MHPSSQDEAAKNRTLLRRASGLLSTISVPFINHRPSLHLDTSRATLDTNHHNHRLSQVNCWPQWNQPDDINAPHVQIVIETASTVHTSGQRHSDEVELPPLTPDSATMTRINSHVRANLKPRPYHYRKSRFIDQTPKQSYTVASRRLRSDCKSMEQLFLDGEEKQSTEEQDFEAAFSGAFTLSPVLDSPDSETSEMDNFSHRRRSQSLHSFQSSSMQSRIESSSSSGYTGSQAYNMKLTEEKLCRKGDQRQEDYGSWIKFESPMDLLSPSISNQSTSPSATSAYSIESPVDQQPSGSIPMIREEMQSFLGVNTSSYNTNLPPISPQTPSENKLSFTLHPLPSHWNVSQFQEKLSPNNITTTNNNNTTSNQKSFRKKISQTFQVTFRKNKNNSS